MKLLAASLTTAGLLGITKTALALSCIPCAPFEAPNFNPFQENIVLKVPKNFVIRLRHADDINQILTSSQAFSCSTISDLNDGTKECRPNPLIGGATTIHATLNNQSRDLTIITSSQADHQAPGRPTLSEVEWFGPDNTWNPNGGGVNLRITPANSNLGDIAAYEVEVANNGANPEIYSLRANSSTVSGGNRYSIGQAVCACSGRIDKAKLQNSFIRVRAVDLAGNRGPWSASENIGNVSSGCTHLSSSPEQDSRNYLLFALLLIPVLLRRRQANN